MLCNIKLTEVLNKIDYTTVAMDTTNHTLVAGIVCRNKGHKFQVGFLCKYVNTPLFSRKYIYSLAIDTYLKFDLYYLKIWFRSRVRKGQSVSVIAFRMRIGYTYRAWLTYWWLLLQGPCSDGTPPSLDLFRWNQRLLWNTALICTMTTRNTRHWQSVPNIFDQLR
jgi:hypothetical protein